MSSSSARLVRIQALSGVLFSIFLLLHLANTASAIVSAGSYDAFQTVARQFYQNVAVEIALVAAALVVHIAVSLQLAGRRKGGRAPLDLRLHRYSGYFLLVFVFGHALATRGVALLQGAPVGGHYVSFTFLTWPAYFYPYYSLLFAAGACHLLSGLRLALARLGLRGPMRVPLRVVYAAIAVVIGFGLLGIAALGGLVRPIAIPERAAIERSFESFLPTALLPWRSEGKR